MFLKSRLPLKILEKNPDICIDLVYRSYRKSFVFTRGVLMFS